MGRVEQSLQGFAKETEDPEVAATRAKPGVVPRPGLGR